MKSTVESFLHPAGSVWSKYNVTFVLPVSQYSKRGEMIQIVLYLKAIWWKERNLITSFSCGKTQEITYKIEQIRLSKHSHKSKDMSIIC